MELHGNIVSSTKLVREVLRLRLEVLGEHHVDSLATMHTLAWSLDDLGEVNEAIEWNRR